MKTKKWPHIICEQCGTGITTIIGGKTNEEDVKKELEKHVQENNYLLLHLCSEEKELYKLIESKNKERKNEYHIEILSFPFLLRIFRKECSAIFAVPVYPWETDVKKDIMLAIIAYANGFKTDKVIGYLEPEYLTPSFLANYYFTWNEEFKEELNKFKDEHKDLFKEAKETIDTIERLHEELYSGEREGIDVEYYNKLIEDLRKGLKIDKILDEYKNTIFALPDRSKQFHVGYDDLEEYTEEDLVKF